MLDSEDIVQKQAFFSKREKRLILIYLCIASLPCIIYFTGQFDINYPLTESSVNKVVTNIALGEVSSVHEIIDNGISGTCEVKQVTTQSVCGFNFLIGEDMANGIDLTPYNNVNFSISVTGPRLEHSVRFQFRNFNEAYSDTAINDSLKYMGITADGFARPVSYSLPLKQFGVESWWLYNNEIGMEHSGLDFSNVIDFIVVHNGLHTEGLYNLTITDVTLTGQRLRMETTIILSFSILIVLLSTSLFRYHKKLKIAGQKAEAANEAKSRFLSNMSHEIRTPLNSILGTLQVIEDKQANSESRKLVHQSLRAAKSLLVIINDILDFSKIEADSLSLESKPFSFLNVVDGVISDVRTQVDSKGLTLVRDVDEDYVDGWKGDAVRIRQILLNLVSNAVKFTDDGNVEISVNSEQNDTKTCLRFVVSDTGIGMSKKYQSTIFERFSQADTSVTRKYGGTGLGMAITINLIRLMNGNIHIESSKGEGTTVYVTIPMEPITLEALQQSKDRKSESPDLSNTKILIAEDNEINQTIIEAMLEPTNARIDFVLNGKQAVEVSKTNQYDLILMDIQMPEMDGEEAFTCIRGFNPDIPIIALTANVMQEEINHYRTVGFNAHVGKPIIKEELFEKMVNVLNRNQH